MARKLLKPIEILIFLCLTHCVTPAPVVVNKEPCFCGWITPDFDAPKVCAIWQKHWTSTERQPVLASSPSERCDLVSCRKLFKTVSTCSPIELWAELPAPASKGQEDGCFCDFVAVQNHPGGEVACAVWKAGDRYLREYHFTKDCEPATCGGQPFQDSGRACAGKFRKFFINGGNLPPET